ncbi:MAG: oxalate decarboxylase [Paraburkholderia sp.]|jgi:oxalate decarboxylase|nr:oxalate decarboxylase [Paraburkholderia sp.]
MTDLSQCEVLAAATAWAAALGVADTAKAVSAGKPARPPAGRINAHKRYPDGGWAGDVTHDNFAILEDTSGISMRLAANGVREMLWHQQAKWAITVVRG